MDQLSFCIFSIRHGPQMEQTHTALCKFEMRRSRTFAFHLCEPRLTRNFFHIIIVEMTHFCTVVVLTLYRTYQDAF